MRDGLEKRIRPLTMTCLTAIFGMLPAAFSTRIGSQTQQPLAIVVVGGMITTMLLMNLMPVLYSFYGHREPPARRGPGALIARRTGQAIRLAPSMPAGPTGCYSATISETNRTSGSPPRPEALKEVGDEPLPLFRLVGIFEVVTLLQDGIRRRRLRRTPACRPVWQGNQWPLPSSSSR